ncbi:MAG: hypothetical protein SGPRY_006884, partial [Prymnesium sp.]
MGQSALPSLDLQTEFSGKSCGGTFTPGETLTVSVRGGGTYMLEVMGGTLVDGEATCGGTRYANNGEAKASYDLRTSQEATEVQAWIGRGTGATSADMPEASGLMSASFCFEEGCSFLVSFTSQGEFVEATLIFRGEAWVAIGASPDSKMGQDAFAVISSFETTIESHVYHLNGREVDGVTEGWIAKAKVEKSSQEDGVTTLVVSEQITICRDQPTKLIACHGKTNMLGPHHGQVRITLDGGSASIERPVMEWYLGLHVVFLCFAWLFSAPLALLVALLRHTESFKPLLSRTRHKEGKAYWYLLHRNLLVSSVSLTLSGGLLMIATTKLQLFSLHDNFGVASLVLCFAQMLSGFLRPKPGARLRPSWEWLHQVLGVSTFAIGPVLVRLAWHDAGTYDRFRDLYGPRGAMRFACEASNPSNNGLDKARQLLEPIKHKVPLLGYADLWQLAAVVSIEMMGGPRIPFRAGRVDAEGPEACTPPGMLPDPHATADELRSVFSRMGFNDRDIVALLGAHTIGICRMVNSGFRGPWVKSSLRFDNSYYRDLLTAGRWVYNGKQFNSVAGDGMMMLDSDMRLSTDEIFSTWARLFATNEELWFDKFSNSFSKLAELGHSSLQPVEYVLASSELGYLQAAVKEAARLLQQLVHKHRVGPTFIRLAWNDAISYNSTDGTCGARASLLVDGFPLADSALREAWELLEPIKVAVPRLSYADLWQLAAVVSVEMMGGPKIPFRAGRVDAEGPEACSWPGWVPDAHTSADELRLVFSSAGFDEEEMVALLGAHTLGRCHPQFSGFNGPWSEDTLSFDNSYFSSLLEKQWAPEANAFTNSLRDGTLMLATDLLLVSQPSLAKWVRAFAADQRLFFSAFSLAFQRLSELGHLSLRETSYSLPALEPLQTEAEADSVCFKRTGGMCEVSLSWALQEEEVITASLQGCARLVEVEASSDEVTGAVAWLALAVSREGRMVLPQPSRALVGSAAGVRRHLLTEQDVASISRSAPLDEEGWLAEASFEFSNGFTSLHFTTNLSWFTSMDSNLTGTLDFLYAHGKLGETVGDLGYHGFSHRGSVRVDSFGRKPYVLPSQVKQQVQNAVKMIAEVVRTQLAAPSLVRLAWHDAGTYNASDGSYGPRGAMRFACEASNPSNNGLDKARQLLEPIKHKVPLLGYADLWQLAAIVSIEMMGGPRIPF